MKVQARVIFVQSTTDDAQRTNMWNMQLVLILANIVDVIINAAWNAFGNYKRGMYWAHIIRGIEKSFGYNTRQQNAILFRNDYIFCNVQQRLGTLELFGTIFINVVLVLWSYDHY